MYPRASPVVVFEASDTTRAFFDLSNVPWKSGALAPRSGEQAMGLSAPVPTRALLQRHTHPQVIRHERPLIRRLIDDLRDRFSRPMSRLGLNPNQHRSRPRLIRLHGCRDLETMSRHHAVI